MKGWKEANGISEYEMASSVSKPDLYVFATALVQPVLAFSLPI